MKHRWRTEVNMYRISLTGAGVLFSREGAPKPDFKTCVRPSRKRARVFPDIPAIHLPFTPFLSLKEEESKIP